MFRITAEIEGLGGVEELLTEVNALLGERGITGAELKSTTRNDDAPSNATLFEYLAEAGRDFRGPADGDSEAIATAVAVVIDQRLTSLARKLNRRDRMRSGDIKRTRLLGKSTGDIESAWARATGAAALWAGMREWMFRVSHRIDAQVTSSGSGLGDLSKRYAEYKQKRFGFIRPIGVATGQMLDNVGPSVASGAIRILRERDNSFGGKGDRLISRLGFRAGLAQRRSAVATKRRARKSK